MVPCMAARGQPKRRRGILALAVATSLALGAGEPAPWPDGPVEVERIHQAGVYEIVRDERTVPLRLAGLHAVTRADRPLDLRARREAARWLESGPVRLVGARTNRRGELEGFLRLYDGSTLNARLLAAGYALLVVPSGDGRHGPELRAAQREASRRRAGIWGGGRVRVEDVRRVYRRFATLCGNAGTVRRDRDGTWLVHLGDPYPRHDLTVRIAKEHAHAFGKPDEVYLRHDLCVTGRVRPRPNAAEVDVADPVQILDRGGHRAR